MGFLKALSYVNVIFVSFQGYSNMAESHLLQKNGDYDI